MTTYLCLDLDGTLTDPRLGMTRCLRHALERLDRPVPPEAELERFIGPPLRETFRTLLESTDPDLVEQGVRAYRERYATVGLYENRVYETIQETLATLQGRSIALFVVTSKPHVYAERILDHFDLLKAFRAVYGPELDGRYDDKRELLARVLSERRLDPRAGWMVGDRDIDVLAASACGVPSAGVLWGFGADGELRRAGAHRLLRRPSELLELVQAPESAEN